MDVKSPPVSSCSCRHLQVSIVGAKVNASLTEQGGVQAGVPTKARVQSPEKLGFAANGSVDAVVLVREFGELSGNEKTSFLNEVARVLKPGKPLIFVEQGAGECFLRLLSFCSLTPYATSLQCAV